MTVVRGSAELRGQMRAAAASVPARVHGLLQHHGTLLRSRVQAHASGRPGPRAQTGDYRRSIMLEIGMDGSDGRAEVSTNKPQANRLEFGFSGTDSLGRSYDSPPLPHFGPAFDETVPEFTDGAQRLLDDLL